MGVNQRRAGAILSYVSLAVNAIGSFLYVPILIGVLGASQYGVYQLIGSIIAYLSVMDMGLSTTLNRFYVRTSVIGDKKDEENLLAHAAIIYGVLTVLAVIVGFVFLFLLGPLFGESFTAEELDLARQMMALVIINCVIVLPGNWFLAIINANERFVFARSLAIVKYVLQILSVIAVLQMWQNAIAVLIVQVFFNALAIIAYIFYVKGKLKIHSKFHYWDWHLVGSMFAFSFLILLNMIFDEIFWKTGQVILGAITGAVAAGIYGVVCQVVTAGYISMSSGVTSVFLPRLTAISARTEDMSEINEIFIKVGRIQAILVWAVCAGFIVLGREFVYLWAGIEYWDVYPATVILMLAQVVSLTQGLSNSVLQAKNKMGFKSVLYIFMAIADVIISIPMCANYGVIGCAATAGIIIFIGTFPVLNTFYHRKIGINIPAFFKSLRSLVIPVVAAALATWTFATYVTPAYSWCNLIFQVFFFIVVFFALLWAIGFNDYEKGLFRSGFKRLKRSAQ